MEFVIQHEDGDEIVVRDVDDKAEAWRLINTSFSVTVKSKATIISTEFEGDTLVGFAARMNYGSVVTYSLRKAEAGV